MDTNNEPYFWRPKYIQRKWYAKKLAKTVKREEFFFCVFPEKHPLLRLLCKGFLFLSAFKAFRRDPYPLFKSALKDRYPFCEALCRGSYPFCKAFCKRVPILFVRPFLRVPSLFVRPFLGLPSLFLMPLVTLHCLIRPEERTNHT